MMVTVWLLMLLLGLGAIGVGTIVIAIATRKIWLIPAVGAAVLLGLMGLGIIGSFFFVRASHSIQAATVEMLPQPSNMVSTVSLPTGTVVHSSPPVAYSSGLKINVTWLLILGVVLVAATVRRVFGPPHGHGILRAWPVLVVLGFVAVYALIGVNAPHERAMTNARAAADAAQHQALETRRQAEQLAQEHRTESEKQRQIAQQDIHELMNQFDQPRIPVSPQPPLPPAPPAPAAAPPAAQAPAAPAPTTIVATMSNGNGEMTASMSADSKKAETKKSSAASRKQKKPKSGSDSSKPAPQAVAGSNQSKTTEKKQSQNPKPTENESKLALAEEAEANGATVEERKSKARPAWVDEAPKRTGNTRREVLATDEYQTVDECYLAGDICLLLKTWQRMQQLGGHQEVGALPSITINNRLVTANGAVVSSNGAWVDYRIRELNSIGINADYLRRELVSKDSKNNEPREYVETVERSFGPMKKLYLQIEFSPSFDRELRRHWEAHERNERFAMVGVGAGSLLGFLGLAFALLKIDTWTKGYYTKRLFLILPLTILSMFSVYAMLIKLGVDLPH